MDTIADWFIAHYDPFYGWVLTGAVVAGCAVAVAWFFSVLRPVAGAVFVGVVAFLTGFRKAQHVEQDRQAARDRNTWR